MTALPDKLPKRRNMNRLAYASTACYHSDTLRPWMRMYAEWLAIQPGRPSKAEKQAIANRLAHDKVSPRALVFLQQRADFKEYHDKFAQGAVTAARARLEADSPWYIDQHRLGLEAAIAEKDYKAIPNYTGPVIERVWPRREAPTTGTQITINLSTRQQAELTLPPAELMPAEIVPDEQPHQSGG